MPLLATLLKFFSLHHALSNGHHSQGLNIDLAPKPFIPARLPVFLSLPLRSWWSFALVACMSEILLPLHCPPQPFRKFEPSQRSFNPYLKNFYFRNLVFDSILFSFNTFALLGLLPAPRSLTARDNDHLAIDLCSLLFPRTLSQHKCPLIRAGMNFRDRAPRPDFRVFFHPSVDDRQAHILCMSGR